MLIAIWTLSFTLLLPPLLGFWGTLGLEPSTFSCTILKKNGSSPKKFLFVLGFIVPCVVISVSYFCIYWRVRKSRKNLEAHAGPTRRKAGGFQRREDSRVTRLMLTIFLCFLLCFMPLMLVNVIDDKIKIPILHVIASVLAWASSVINPFIYAGTNKLYREAYKQILCPVSAKIPTTGPKPTHSHSSKVSSPQATWNFMVLFILAMSYSISNVYIMEINWDKHKKLLIFLLYMWIIQNKNKNKRRWK